MWTQLSTNDQPGSNEARSSAPGCNACVPFGQDCSHGYTSQLARRRIPSERSVKAQADPGAWFLEFDWAAWDRQLEADVQAGKFDRLAQQVRGDHAAGKTTPL
jgi:hypothetical protein